MMENALYLVILLAMFAVVVILMIGIGSFGKGGAFNQKYSNKLMQYRIAAQFVAVMLIVTFVYFFGKGAQ